MQLLVFLTFKEFDFFIPDPEERHNGGDQPHQGQHALRRLARRLTVGPRPERKARQGGRAAQTGPTRKFRKLRLKYYVLNRITDVIMSCRIWRNFGQEPA